MKDIEGNELRPGHQVVWAPCVRGGCMVRGWLSEVQNDREHPRARFHEWEHIYGKRPDGTWGDTGSIREVSRWLPENAALLIIGTDNNGPG